MSATHTAKFRQCPCTGSNLDKLLHPAILVMLIREPLHGYELVRRLAGLKMFKGRSPDPTGVYRLIKQMEKDGLVRSQLELSTSGPAKRSNHLTADGRRCLLRWQDTLENLQMAIDELLHKIKESARRQALSHQRNTSE